MATTTVKPGAKIEQLFADKCPKSYQMFQRAVKVLPNGVEHDNRLHRPFPIYVERAEGGNKWDLDGNRYVDFVIGHGALLLGHNHPVVTGKVMEQLKRGTHLGAAHANMVEWAEWVNKLVPSGEMVRFFSSGTEATMMAMRMCRSLTRRNKILKFQSHFHGWHDYATVAVGEPFDVPTSSGVPKAVQNLVVAIPANDAQLVRDTIKKDGDIACLILEPSGASYGKEPTTLEFVRELRKICTEMDVPLIFDEVITGFRYSPGGYQAEFGITPDITTLAKILAGGYPGGAVAGQARFLRLLEERDEPGWNRGGRIAHPGTYNGNPVSAAAGAACLQQVATGEPHAQANRMGERLRAGMNKAFQRQGLKGMAYGSHSFFHVSFTGKMDKSSQGAAARPFNTAMLVNGAQLMGGGGMTCEAHTEADIDLGIEVFDKSLALLKAEGILTS